MNIIKDLFHLSMQAAGYRETLDFYCNKLGFEQMFELKVKDFKKMLQLEGPDKYNEEPWLTYLRVAPEEYLEIFNGIINPPDFEIRKPDSTNTVIHSYALGCEDPEETQRELEMRGLKSENGFFTDPTGFRFTLVARKGIAASKKRMINMLAGVSIYVNDLNYMSSYLEGMGMKKVCGTASAVQFVFGEKDQYIELLQSAKKLETGDEDILGHIALQVNTIDGAVWEWGCAGVRTCLQPIYRDQPFEVKKGVVGNFAVDGCEIVWAVSKEGNRFEIMRQPGDTIQQKWEREHPF